MALDPATVRARTLELLKKQADAAPAFFSVTDTLLIDYFDKALIGWHLLRVDPRLVPRDETIAEADLRVMEIIKDVHEDIRHLTMKLQTVDQAAACTAICVRTESTKTLLKSPLNRLIDAYRVGSTIGIPPRQARTPPALAKEWIRYSGIQPFGESWHQRYRYSEALCFFGKGLFGYNDNVAAIFNNPETWQ
jgi:hypothetical protein